MAEVIDAKRVLAAREVMRRRRGRESLAGYANAIEIPGKPVDDDPEAWLFKPVELGLASHHLLALNVIERATSQRYGRYMIFMPPGSAKSTFASVVAPTGLMGKTPGTKIILASYGSDLARKHGRRARQIVRSPQFSSIFSGQGKNIDPSGHPIPVTISADSSAANEWALTNGSEYLAAGLLAGLTGNRAHHAIVDDPIKGREQADSPTIREKTWEAYNDDLQTRLIPGGSIGIIQCMTGDTLVLMANGTEKALRDVRSGDRVATYDAGNLGASTVLKWKNNGPDSVYEITTRSGAVVRANERHPFLIYEGGSTQWTRLQDLRPGAFILRATGVSGAMSDALPQSAGSLPSAEACAIPITTSIGGPKGFVRRLLERIRRLESARSSSIDTGSRSTITSACCWIREAVAQFAAGRLSEQEIQSTGTTSCASTTVTSPTRYVGSYATTATSQSAEARPLKRLRLQRDTSDFTPDEIVSIEPCGAEDVFDIEVDGTENFIANGLVSHNTRWHENDLAGRLLPESYAGESGPVKCRDGKIWQIVNLPAECERADDPLGRNIGEMLWPEWFDPEHWAPFRLQSRAWAALFQQRPRPDEGGIFKEAWCRNRYGVIPATANTVVHSWDTAQKEKQINDPSVMTSWRHGYSAQGYYLADVYRDRVDYPTLKRKVIAYAERDRPRAILIEDKSSGQSLIQELRSTTSLPIIPIEPDGNKLFRASEVSSIVEAGLMHLPENADWLVDFEGEFFGFPLSTNDDQVDSTSQFLKWVHLLGGPIESGGAGMPWLLADQMAGRDSSAGFGAVSRADSDTSDF